MNSAALRRAGRSGLAGCLLALAGVAASWSIPSTAEAGIRWRTGEEAPVAKMNKQEIQTSLEAISAARRGEAGPKRFVVSFDRPLLDSEKDALKASGLTLMNYVSENSYFAAVDADNLNPGAIAAVEPFRNIRPIQREWKLHPDLLSGKVQPWSIVGEAKPGAAESNPMVAAYIMFHPDVDFDGKALGVLAEHGAALVSPIEMVNGAVIELPYENIKALADADEVMWIEPPLPQFSELNAENRAITGANTAQAAPYNLNGAGVTVLVYDGGRSRTTHVDFQGRAINLPGDTSSTSDHSTHVSGTIGGAGVANINNRGMAPGVLIVNAGFQFGGGNGFLYTDPGDMIADYTAAVTNHGADIANNSIGNNTEPNGFDCSWQGDYGFTDTIIDSMVRGSINGEPFRIVWAAGNERQGTRCNVEGFGSYYSSGPPANAKNHITVGALNANDDSMTTFSSWGPSDDGRMRPDISAPGCQNGGDGGVTSTSSSSDTAYNSKCGTSMASPTVCGLSALVLQDFRAQYPSRPDPRNSTLKAIWMHTAVDILNPGPDYQSGYGSVRVIPAIEFVRSGNFFENTVSQGGVYTATVVVSPSDTVLKVTIAWDDPAGTPNVNPTLVNDLDLVVTGPGGQYFPWTLNPAAPSANAVRTTRNFRDNNEQVLINNPMPGAYLIEVRGFNVPQGPQPFSLCASPFLVNCSSQGVATLDRNVYNCSSVAGLRVVDCDLNTSDSVVDTVTVHVASTTDPVGFNVLLTEVSPEAATFAATVQLSTSAGVGILQVGHADTVTLTYNDANTGGGMPAVVTSTATVDCAGPVISNVAVPPATISPISATITFNTNETATGLVRYGTSCGALTSSAATGSGTSHSVNLTGLSDNTTYYFSVEATDPSGNFTSDNNGGSCYSFVTPETPDYFTEIFETDNDIDNVSFLFTPNQTFEGYAVCATPIVALPTNPASGTPVTLPDDSPAFTINLTGGQTVKLYGASYSSVFLNPNGNLTFTAADGTTGETLAVHFNKPRISALFDDLGPHQGGTVTWKQESDRLVISYVNVREYNTTNTVTFQYELYFDGRIVLSYLNVGITDGLIGLSRGTGLPVPFFESNFSSYGGCGPRPPIASGGSVATPLGQLIPITLLGSDDGLPDPPAAIRFIVTGLPSNGRLFDPNSGQITSVPHTLSGNGNIVNYDPNCSFLGTDTFTFIVNDFGMSPDGGDSNTATVSIAVGGPTVVASFPLNESPRWTMEGAWAFGVPTGGGGSAGGGSGASDPTSGYTGANVLGYNLAGNYTNNMPEYKLTSAPVNMSGRTGVKVRFQRWLGVESSTYDQASFRVSTDGINFTTVWAHSGASLNPTTGWSLQTYDISAIADNQPTVYLRWIIGPTDGSVIYCGWNIDDIEFLANVPPPPCPNDYNGDCEINFGDISTILAGWGTYDFNDITLVLGAWGNSCN
ncbi:MAG: S8 family serine peptidase [Phycisphaerae bacterium]|nr:S8 family serine peptidase [Phycisphaerae bacterium]